MARAIDAIELQRRMCEICNQDYSDEPCDPSDCVFVRAINETPTLTPPNEWVSVEEKLPEKKQDVLMLFKSGDMAVGWWHDADEHITFWCAYTDDGFYTDCDDMPTHWMSLPGPPAKEEQK